MLQIQVCLITMEPRAGKAHNIKLPDVMINRSQGMFSYNYLGLYTPGIF